MLQTGNPFHLDRYPQPSPGASTRYYGLNLKRLLWEGRPAVLFVLTDVTEREAAFQKIEQSAEEARRSDVEAQEARKILEALLATAPEGIAITDTDGRILYLSQYGRETAALPIPEGQPIPPETLNHYWQTVHLDGVTPAQPEELPIPRVTRSGETIRNEEWILLRPGSAPVQIVVNAGPPSATPPAR